jgi:hypothetical protein
MRLVSGPAWETLVGCFGLAEDGGAGTEGAGGEGERGPRDYLEEGGCIECVAAILVLKELRRALSQNAPGSEAPQALAGEGVGAGEEAEAGAEGEAEAEAEAEAAAVGYFVPKRLGRTASDQHREGVTNVTLTLT